MFKDVPPFVTVSGAPAQPHGLNTVGLERRGFTADTLSLLRKAYKIIFRQGHTVQDAIIELNKLTNDAHEVQSMIDFIQGSQRGIVR